MYPYTRIHISVCVHERASCGCLKVAGLAQEGAGERGARQRKQGLTWMGAGGQELLVSLNYTELLSFQGHGG